jgi:hypothetical protein
VTKKYEPKNQYKLQSDLPASGGKLDAEFSEISDSTDKIEKWIKRSDLDQDTGRLKAHKVNHHNLNPDLLQYLLDTANGDSEQNRDDALAASASADRSANESAKYAKSAETARAGIEGSAARAEESADTAEVAAQSAVESSSESVSSAVDANNAANHAEGSANEAWLSEKQSADWAEYLAGPVPLADGSYLPNDAPESVQSGYFSARWWAAQAQKIVDEGGSWWLGNHAGPPNVDPPAEEGNIYWDTITETFWIFVDGGWHEIGRANATLADEPPKNPYIGDIWMDSGTTAEEYTWTGHEWVSMTGGVSIADDYDVPPNGELHGGRKGGNGLLEWHRLHTGNIPADGDLDGLGGDASLTTQKPINQFLQSGIQANEVRIESLENAPEYEFDTTQLEADINNLEVRVEQNESDIDLNRQLTEANKADIEAEVIARIQGDVDLGIRIDGLEDKFYEDEDIRQLLADEIVARENGDIALAGQIQKEIADRVAADKHLQDQIDELQPDNKDYVEKPADGDDWLVYRQKGGAGEWATATTDLIATNGDAVFRSADGRFKSRGDLPDLANQMEVNRFFWEQLEQLLAEPELPVDRLPIYAEDEPEEYPHTDPASELEPDDQWYQVTDPDFNYDDPQPDDLDLYIWTLVEDDYEWVLWEAEIPEGVVIIKDELPDMEEDSVGNGSLWFDNTQDTMQLFVFHSASDAWIPVAPPTTLEGRVSEGEALQAQIVAQIEKSLQDQSAIVAQVETSLDDQAKIAAKVEELSITKGAVARYVVKGVSVGVATRNGELFLNSPVAADVTYISFAPFDANGNATKPTNPDDIVEFIESSGFRNAGDITRYKAISGDSNALVVEYLSGINDFEVDEAEEVYVYPQNQDLASIEYVDDSLTSKLNNSGSNQLPDDTDWKVKQVNAEGKNKTLIHSVGGQLGVYNLKEPVESHHAATKAYVDAHTSGISASRPPGLRFMCSIVNLPNGYFQWWVKESTGNQHLELSTTDRDGIAWGTNTPREDVKYTDKQSFTIWEVSGGGWKMKVTGTISRIDFHPDHALCYVSSKTALNGGNFANGSGPYFITISGIF